MRNSRWLDVCRPLFLIYEAFGVSRLFTHSGTRAQCSQCMEQSAQEHKWALLEAGILKQSFFSSIVRGDICAWMYQDYRKENFSKQPAKFSVSCNKLSNERESISSLAIPRVCLLLLSFEENIPDDLARCFLIAQFFTVACILSYYKNQVFLESRARTALNTPSLKGHSTVFLLISELRLVFSTIPLSRSF
jgi:hypothetical protein